MLGLLTTILLSACGETTLTPTPSPATPAEVTGASSNTSSTKVMVVSTISVVADFVRNIGGNRVELYDIIQPGVDAHSYEPTSDDSKYLAAAQIIFANGLNLEAWLDKTIKNSGTKGRVVLVSEGVKLIHKADDSDFKDGDPHIWHSTVNAKKMVDNIAAGLGKVDPAGKEIYLANAKAYNIQIDEAYQKAKAQIESISPERRKLVTNHEAFTYFADQFGLEIVGSVIPSFDSTAEPSAAELSELVKKIKAEKVPAIFTENTINPKLAEQIGKEAGVKIFSNLYGDGLGEQGSAGDTYLKMIVANATNIANGLK
ncbi:MAG: zinc ABC transporter substrate-binding protein [Chloroflexota bacterium]